VEQSSIVWNSVEFYRIITVTIKCYQLCCSERSVKFWVSQAVCVSSEKDEEWHCELSACWPEERNGSYELENSKTAVKKRTMWFVNHWEFIKGIINCHSCRINPSQFSENPRVITDNPLQYNDDGHGLSICCITSLETRTASFGNNLKIHVGEDGGMAVSG
jgi:hypothetical protein